MNVYGSTANLPREHVIAAVEALTNGFYTEDFGMIESDHIQLTPQARGVIDEALVDTLFDRFSGTKFRFHTNIKIEDKLKIVDCSSPNSQAYWARVGELSNRIKAPLYSFHAGFKNECSKKRLIENYFMIERYFDCEIAIEHGYPTREGRKQWWLNCWSELDWMINKTEINYVIDLSHINIIARNEGRQDDLLKYLLENKRCKEIHVSANDGLKDSHRRIESEQWWYAFIDNFNAESKVFSEGNHTI